MNPEPKELIWLSAGLLNSLNKSSKGEPGGNWKGKGLTEPLIVWVVEIFTTDGINFSAKSANEAGAFLALTGVEKKIIKIKFIK